MLLYGKAFGPCMRPFRVTVAVFSSCTVGWGQFSLDPPVSPPPTPTCGKKVPPYPPVGMTVDAIWAVLMPRGSGGGKGLHGWSGRPQIRCTAWAQDRWPVGNLFSGRIKRKRCFGGGGGLPTSGSPWHPQTGETTESARGVLNVCINILSAHSTRFRLVESSGVDSVY